MMLNMKSSWQLIFWQKKFKTVSLACFHINTNIYGQFSLQFTSHQSPYISSHNLTEVTWGLHPWIYFGRRNLRWCPWPGSSGTRAQLAQIGPFLILSRLIWTTWIVRSHLSHINLIKFNELSHRIQWPWSWLSIPMHPIRQDLSIWGGICQHKIWLQHSLHYSKSTVNGGSKKKTCPFLHF